MAQLRSDAREKRSRLLEAAESVFLDAGPQAPLDAIVERAGVGRATLFRHFPDRKALLLALLERSLVNLENEAACRADEPDGLRHLLESIATAVADRAPLIDYWQSLSRDAPELVAIIERLIAAFERPIATAIRAGVCRADFESSDILLLTSMVGAVRYARSVDERSRLSRKALDIMIAATSPDDCRSTPRSRERRSRSTNKGA